MSNLSFKNLNLREELLNALDSLEFTKMTNVQNESLPHILGGKNVTVKAGTGTGKTIAFALGILNDLSFDSTSTGAQSIVVCPTRELAFQVSEVIRELARFLSNVKVVTFCGGKDIELDKKTLKYGADIIVGTPGRLRKLISINTLPIYGIKKFILDEADTMIDMGHLDDVLYIFSQCGKKSQTMLFSATFPEKVLEAKDSIHKNEELIDASGGMRPINHNFYKFGYDIKKRNLLLYILNKHLSNRVIIFCNTKSETFNVSKFLKSKDIYSIPINSDLDQRDRNEALIQFSNESCPVLVATDIAARGIDISKMDLVINFSFPKDLEQYVHRSGRTGRNSSKGETVSIVQENEQKYYEIVIDYCNKNSEKETTTELENLDANDGCTDFKVKAPMRTICIWGGKKNKLRKIDIIGALTGDIGISGELIGKIDLLDNRTYVAIKMTAIHESISKIKAGKIKGKKFRCSLI